MSSVEHLQLGPDDARGLDAVRAPRATRPRPESMPTPSSVNPSDETIRIGPLGIRFLLTGDDTRGSVSVFEMTVPAGQKLAAPAHKNDAYEETLYGIEGVLT